MFRRRNNEICQLGPVRNKQSLLRCWGSSGIKVGDVHSFAMLMYFYRLHGAIPQKTTILVCYPPQIFTRIFVTIILKLFIYLEIVIHESASFEVSCIHVFQTVLLSRTIWLPHPILARIVQHSTFFCFLMQIIASPWIILFELNQD